jgi:hypothetical protein
VSVLNAGPSGYSMNANWFGKLVTPSAAQVIGRNRVITSGGSRIARGVRVGHAYIRVIKLRRVHSKVFLIESFEVRPLKPSSGHIFSIIKTELYH